MSNKSGQHSAEHHRIAFETYFATRNWAAVARSVNTSYSTPYRWSLPTYVCPFQCPWHCWDQLVIERERSAAAQLELISEGNLDPLEQDRALRQPPPYKTDPDGFSAPAVYSDKKRLALAGIHKSDVERLAQYELLYNKLFFELTGIYLSYGTYRDADGKAIDIRSVYAGASRSSSQEGAIRSLEAIMARIEKLRVRLGLDQNKTAEEAAQEVAEQKKKKLSLADLRDIQRKLENTTPQEIEVMRQVMHSEQQVLSDVTGS